jgi:hypothetical protein
MTTQATALRMFYWEYILFICGLSDDAASSSDYIASNDRMINE